MEEPLCSVCYCGKTKPDNRIVVCKKCNEAVHQNCFGVDSITDEEWFCRKCETGMTSARCELCPNRGGAMKLTISGSWAHLSCAIWIPETFVSDPNRMEPIEGIMDIDPARQNLTCLLCRKTSGVCIQCSYPKCSASFHVICALNSKWHLRWSQKGSDDIATIAFCSKHKAKADPPVIPPKPGRKKPKIVPVEDGPVERRGRPRKLQPPPNSPPPSPDRVTIPPPIPWPTLPDNSKSNLDLLTGDEETQLEIMNIYFAPMKAEHVAFIGPLPERADDPSFLECTVDGDWHESFWRRVMVEPNISADALTPKDAATEPPPSNFQNKKISGFPTVRVFRDSAVGIIQKDGRFGVCEFSAADVKNSLKNFGQDSGMMHQIFPRTSANELSADANDVDMDMPFGETSNRHMPFGETSNRHMPFGGDFDPLSENRQTEFAESSEQHLTIQIARVPLLPMTNLGGEGRCLALYESYQLAPNLYKGQTLPEPWNYPSGFQGLMEKGVEWDGPARGTEEKGGAHAPADAVFFPRTISIDEKISAISPMEIKVYDLLPKPEDEIGRELRYQQWLLRDAVRQNNTKRSALLETVKQEIENQKIVAEVAAQNRQLENEYLQSMHWKKVVQCLSLGIPDRQNIQISHEMGIAPPSLLLDHPQRGGKSCGLPGENINRESSGIFFESILPVLTPPISDQTLTLASSLSLPPEPLEIKIEKSPEKVFEEEAECGVCSYGESIEGNQILFCDGCNLAVHQSCYGIGSIPEEDWYCEQCTKGDKNVRCCLCPNEGGPMKRTNCNRWAHVLCALWLPEIVFTEKLSMSGIDGVQQARSNGNSECSICLMKIGCCITCAESSCEVSFHPLCAWLEGYMADVQLDDANPKKYKITCVCPSHETVGRKTDEIKIRRRKLFEISNTARRQTSRPQTGRGAAATGGGLSVRKKALREDEYPSNGCQICFGTPFQFTSPETLVACEKCDAVVHSECASISSDRASKKWLCPPCSFGNSDSNVCKLCPRLGGILQPTTAGDWVHPVCVRFHLSLQSRFFDVSVPVDISTVPSERFFSMCFLCKRKDGACVQCNGPSCGRLLHPLCARWNGCCAQHTGRRGGISAGQSDEELVVYQVMCRKHSPHSQDVQLPSEYVKLKAFSQSLHKSRQLLGLVRERENMKRETVRTDTLLVHSIKANPKSLQSWDAMDDMVLSLKTEFWPENWHTLDSDSSLFSSSSSDEDEEMIDDSEGDSDASARYQPPVPKIAPPKMSVVDGSEIVPHDDIQMMLGVGQTERELGSIFIKKKSWDNRLELRAAKDRVLSRTEAHTRRADSLLAFSGSGSKIGIEGRRTSTRMTRPSQWTLEVEIPQPITAPVLKADTISRGKDGMFQRRVSESSLDKPIALSTSTPISGKKSSRPLWGVPAATEPSLSPLSASKKPKKIIPSTPSAPAETPPPKRKRGRPPNSARSTPTTPSTPMLPVVQKAVAPSSETRVKQASTPGVRGRPPGSGRKPSGTGRAAPSSPDSELVASVKREVRELDQMIETLRIIAAGGTVPASMVLAKPNPRHSLLSSFIDTTEASHLDISAGKRRLIDDD